MVRVYVSSTFSDLSEYRKAVRESIRQMRHEDVAMEYYAAEPRRPLDRCLADVRACDLYVVVVAWRYGYVPDGYDASITELEYRAAVEAGKPVLAFVMSDEHPWPPKLMENRPEVTRFRDELTAEWMAGLFTTPDDLARRVVESLHLTGSTEPPADWDAYRQAVVERYRWVRLSVIAGTQDKRLARIPLDEVFVPQQLRSGRPDYDVPQDEVVSATSSDASRVLGTSRRQVVLGGPGSGKSTLFHATMLAVCDPSALDRVPPALRGVRVPLLVELRQYVLSGCPDFLTYWEKTARVDIAALTELLSGDEALVLFDGLDEIFDPAVRAQVVDQFTAFTAQFPTTHVLVSSRIVGYDDTELGLAEFEHHTLLDFGLREIREFVPRWYQHYVVDSEDRDAAGLIGRITDNPRLLELAGNPLLLTMMAIIYQHHDLPEKRWQLYVRCTGVLLEEWDVKRKKIESKETLKLDFLVSGDQKSEILQRVAFHMLTQDDQLSELNAIRYAPLRAVVAEYLETQYDRSRGEARALATEILNHLRERTHILAETGDGIFGFVHRTFMEYFAAGHVLTEFNRRKADYRWLIDEVYLKYWNDDRWREPLLLLSGMLTGQGSPIREVVDALLEHSVLFAAQCLGEAGQVRPEDRTWSGRVLEYLVWEITALLTKRPPNVEELIAAFGRLVSFVPVSDVVSNRVRGLTSSNSMHERVAGWQLDVAFKGRRQRRVIALKGLWHSDFAVRRAAVSTLEKEWPGDRAVYLELVELLKTERNSKVREPLIAALDRDWPRQREVFHALTSNLGPFSSQAHRIWTVDHLATTWSGDEEVRDFVLWLGADAGPNDAVLIAAAKALARGWRYSPSILPALLHVVKSESAFSRGPVAICALVEIDSKLAVDWLSASSKERLLPLLPSVIACHGHNRIVVVRLLDLAKRGAQPVRQAVIGALEHAAIRFPGTELMLRGLGQDDVVARQIVAKAMKRYDASDLVPTSWLDALHIAASLPDDQAHVFWAAHERLGRKAVSECRAILRGRDGLVVQGLLPLIDSVTRQVPLHEILLPLRRVIW